MATIILQAAGAFIGGLFGPVGATIATAAGAIGGYLIDRALLTPTQKLSGPRLEGARPFTAEEGAPLPRIYGAARVGGAIIWATRFEENRTVKRQGGKGFGGPKQELTEYSYYGNVAFALCEGEIAGVRRVWADGEELDLAKIDMRIYRGTQDQQVDPLIAVKQGAGNAPAYRGVAYAVFERLPLGPYGNRIPQLQFEVLRPIGKLERQIEAVCLIPGSTEYGLSTSQIDRQTGLTFSSTRLGELASAPLGPAQVQNRHVLHGQTDMDASLDELQALYPNLKNVALVVAWFGDDLRCGHCRIEPRVTQHGDGYSQAWKVAGLNRATARLVSQTADGPAYGGSPSDASVLQAIAAIKARGWKVTLYPFVMMDVPQGNALPYPYGGSQQAAYPWRGRMTAFPGPNTPGAADKTSQARSQIDTFYGSEWGYRRFIRHYATLAAQAGGVDAFLIGSEMRGMTTLRDQNNAFPFVEKLCALAEETRAILGPSVKMSYAADWSEYFGHHPADGSGDLFFHLDALWARPEINAIGVDNYMPLSDWRDTDAGGAGPDEFAHGNDGAAMRRQIAGGEGFDWFYASDQDRRDRKRTPITDGAYGKPWVYRYKDLVGWWSNPHRNRIGGVEQAQPTAWVPKSKPFWFTEVGCPAVDKGANQPNVFLDPKSAESALPHFSNGARDDLAMRAFLGATFEHWRPDSAEFASDGNPLSPLYGGRMVDAARLYVWAWDARPFPAFPLQREVWSDGPNWHRGHWLNGRLGGVAAGELINAILADHDLPAADVEMVGGTASGYVVADPTTARAALEPLLDLHGIAAYETPDQLFFQDAELARDHVAVTDLAVMSDGPIVSSSRLPHYDLPAEAIVAYRDPLRDYQAATSRAYRSPAGSSRQETLNFPGSLEQGLADDLAARRLQDWWDDRSTLTFALPANAPGVELGVALHGAQIGGPLVVTEIEEGLVRRVKGRPVRGARQRVWAPNLPDTPPAPVIAGKPVAWLIDLPMTPGAALPQDQFRLAVWAKPWRTQSVYASPEAGAFEYRTSLTSPAAMGVLVEDLGTGFSGRVDRASHVVVDLIDGEAARVSRLQMLNGANAAALLADNGVWEVFQFETADEIAPGRWRLGNLLRGQLGTEDAATGAAAGAPFVLLDDSVRPAGLKASEAGLTLNWRVGPAAEAFTPERVTELALAGGTRAITPLAPVHLRMRSRSDGARLISWVRRGRIDADSWDAPEILLGEERERYQLEIGVAGSAPLRTFELASSSYLYAAEDFAADFPIAPPGLQVTVRQIGARAGLPASKVFAV